MILAGVVGASRIEPAPASAMAADAGKLIWYAPENVTVDGSNNVTAWPDNSGNGFNMDTKPTTANLPVWSTDHAVFNGTTGLRTTGNGPFFTEFVTGGEAITMFAVFQGNRASQAASTNVSAVLLAENESNATNRSWAATYLSATFGGTGNTYNARSNRFSQAHQVPTTPPQGTDTTPVIAQFNWGRTRASSKVNNANEVTQAADISAGNVPDSAQRLSLGGRWNNTGSSEPFTGKIYEIFVTSNVDPANLTAIYNELAAKYEAIL